MSRRSKRPLSRLQKVGLALAATLLFGGGLYFGVQVAKPPPPPDLGGLMTEPASDEPPGPAGAGSSGSDSAPGEPVSPDEPVSQDEPVSPDEPEGSGRRDGLDAAEVPGLEDLEGLDRAPRIALVIDDLGRDVGDVDRLEALGIPITYSVLPFEVRTPQVVSALRSRGLEYLCHLPMEAKGDADPGPGALAPSMSDAELRAATERALDAVPGAVGVNNHMGSAVMSDRRAASVVLRLVARRQLYFIDSRTSVDTLGYTLARGLGVPATERQVFLDAAHDPASIRKEWRRLLSAARERGTALAIAHPHDVTLGVLQEVVPAARQAGYEFVTASRLLDR